MKKALNLEQRIGQRLTQQQLRFVRLLELSAPEVDETVERELEDNPALEAIDASPAPALPTETTAPDSDQWRGAASSGVFLPGAASSREQEATPFTPRDDSESLGDVLRREVAEREVSAEVRAVADYIIGNLDGNGWLTRSLDQMLTDLAVGHDIDVSETTGREALRLVRSLDPAGVGAESLADCLLLQLHRLPPSRERDDAIEIITTYFREYSMRHSHKIMSGMQISRSRLDAAHQLILSLNPKPGAAFGGNDSTMAGIIIPDFTVSDCDGRLMIAVNNRYPDLAIEESFAEAMRGMEGRRGRRRKGMEFIASRYADARDFIALMRQRQQTLMSVMTAITARQKNYFESGDVFDLRPMTLRDLAAATGYDQSVISRATANKFVAMPWGEVLPLRSFFSGDVAAGNASAADRQTTDIDENNATKGDDDTENADDALTNRQIQQAIADIIAEEDPRHPLSDEKLRLALLQKGYDISRRTVAKYRDRSGIAVARLRKQF